MTPAPLPLPVDRLAHKLRNPLGCVRLLADELAGCLPEPERALARDLAREVDRTSQILSAAVLASDARVRERRPLDLAELIRAAASETEARLGRDAGWRFLLGDLCGVRPWGDAGLLRSLFVELLSNAVLSGSPAVEVRGERDADGVAVQVLDRGAGLDPALQDPFAPFMSAWPGRVGLGLTVAARIAALHGGRVALREREGGGVVAEVWLPMAGDVAPAGGEP